MEHHKKNHNNSHNDIPPPEDPSPKVDRIDSGDKPVERAYIDMDQLLTAIAESAGKQSLDLSVPHEQLIALVAAATRSDELRDRLVRAQADFDNYRRRAERDAQASRDMRIRDLFTRLVPVLDGFHLALSHTKAPSSDAVFEGCELIRSQMMGIYAEFGLEIVKSEGKSFDPTVHEVMGTTPRPDLAPMTVVSELRPGYVFNGVTLRPAGVIVSSQ
ncbi:MAG: nucleotide exchange factor GrpE [Candidatus Brocadiia bacterium]